MRYNITIETDINSLKVAYEPTTSLSRTIVLTTTILFIVII